MGKVSNKQDSISQEKFVKEMDLGLKVQME